MNHFLLEKQVIKQTIPQSLNATGLSCPRVKLDKAFRVAFVVSMGDSVAAVASFTLKQHNAASAGTTKDLVIDNPYFHKAGVATSFTKVQPTVASASYDLSTIFAAEEGVAVFEILADQLDVDNSFDHVSLEIAAPTAAKVFAPIYVLHEVKHAPAHELIIA